MRTMNFDAIATASPLNRHASVVRDGSGDMWEATLSPQMDHWKAPPLPNGKRPEMMPDLTGMVVGSLTVIRFHGSREGKHARPVWLVRCVCGDYETRRFKTLMSAHAGGAHDCCGVCRRADQLKKRTARPPTEGQRRKQAVAFARIVGDR